MPITPLRQANGERLRLEIALPGYSVWLRAWQVQVGRVVTNHALPRHLIKSESVHVQLTGLLSPQHVFIERVDDEHANAKRL
ncbi:hypothetical protein CCP4SC76_4450003 [Gammaproteobacteria bacterium]